MGKFCKDDLVYELITANPVQYVGIQNRERLKELFDRQIITKQERDIYTYMVMPLAAGDGRQMPSDMHVTSKFMRSVQPPSMERVTLEYVRTLRAKMPDLLVQCKILPYDVP